MSWTISLLFFTSILFIACLILYLFQEKFIFLTEEKLHKNHKYSCSNTFEEIFIKTDGKNKVNALHFKLPKPKGVILFCHGNKGNLTKWGDRVNYFLKYNYEVFVFDYRNYGKSTGKFHEESMYNDAISVYNHLKNSFKEENIIVYGYSLGGTFATKIASRNKPKELILEAPFYNFKKAAQYKSLFTPTFLLKYQFRSDKDILNVIAPITIFHGNKDCTTFFKDSKKLMALNSNIKNEYIEIDKGTHHNLREFAVYKQKLKEILER